MCLSCVDETTGGERSSLPLPESPPLPPRQPRTPASSLPWAHGVTVRFRVPTDPAKVSSHLLVTREAAGAGHHPSPSVTRQLCRGGYGTA